MSGPGSSSWRTPSAVMQAKYNLAPLPEDFEPTTEEQGLLTMYETINKFEKQAARLKEQKIREKLQAKKDEFEQKKASDRKNRRKRKKAKEVASEEAGDESSSVDDESSDASSGSDEDMDNEQSLARRRAAKLDALHEEVEEKEKALAAQENKEEDMRKKFMETNDGMDFAPSLKRKKLQPEDDQNKSLLTNMMAAQTPPHDFSKKLGLKPTKGKVVFPTTPGDQSWWHPPEGAAHPNEGAFLVELEDFDIAKASNGQGNNTIAIKFNAPSDSKRFSINIGGPGHDDFNTALCHFNPRARERGGQLVVNAKDKGIWGKAIALPLSQVPLIFGQPSITLQIQINGEGFDIFIEDKHCVRLEHRVELPSKPCSLFLQFPSTDDYGSPENWLVYKAWWGNKPIMAKGDLSGVAGVNSYDAVHPRKLFISGLKKIYKEAQVDLRRAELERAFRRYGGARGVTCVIPTNSTFAFVEMESERQADLALSEMATKYRLNRARRSRHEALQEERAAKEAGKSGRKAEDSGW